MTSSRSFSANRLLLAGALVWLFGCAALKTPGPGPGGEPPGPKALAVERLGVDRDSPQAAATTIRWVPRVAGGSGGRRYEFFLRQEGGEERVGQVGANPVWDWKPGEAGRYRVRVAVIDDAGNRAESPPSEAYEIVPQIAVQSLASEQAAPRMMGTPVRWKAAATGGVGKRTYQFFVRAPGGKETLAQSGPGDTWEWVAGQEGMHEVRVRVVDSLGNEADRASAFAVAPRLRVTALVPDLPSPRELTEVILWSAAAAGGVGDLSFEFRSRRGDEPERVEQSGPSPSWEWSPSAAAQYRVRVRVTDSHGNAAESPWSEGYDVKPPRIAILPFENLSGESVPLRELRESLEGRLRGLGLPVRDEVALQGFMERHRMRYTAGLDEELAKALRKEIQAGAVLITSIELWKTSSPPPRLGLFCRLVSTGEDPRVLWMDRVSLAGDDHPGLLGLGLVTDPKELWERAQERLAGSLKSYLCGDSSWRRQSGAGDSRFQPKLSYRSGALAAERPLRVVVMPFFNKSVRRNAGEIVTLQFVNQFARSGSFSVVEPGVVRQRLLRFRFVMTEGITLADVNSVANSLGADLVVTGDVRQYDDYLGFYGEPLVDFSAQAIDGLSRKVVWSSKSYGRGRDQVLFWDWRAIGTASSLVSGMTGAIVDRLARGEPAGWVRDVVEQGKAP